MKESVSPEQQYKHEASGWKVKNKERAELDEYSRRSPAMNIYMFDIKPNCHQQWEWNCKCSQLDVISLLDATSEKKKRNPEKEKKRNPMSNTKDIMMHIWK